MPFASITRLATAVCLLACAAAYSQTATDQTPREDQVRWLREHAQRFATVEPGSGFDDLEPFREIIGNARIVALGECTHGSREVFQMKHRLTEFLASEMGFTIFSIEGNMPEAYEVGEYVRGKDGDPKRLIGGMYFWTWNTEEVLAMVEWMRKFNLTDQGTIDFTGFDMQAPEVAMAVVVDLLERAKFERAEEVEKIYGAIKDAPRRKSRFGVATWTFPIEKARGKKVRYTGKIKTEELTDGWAGLWWRADGEEGALAFDNMQARGPYGTTDWTEYAIELDVPPEAININFGVLMPGLGKAWFDDLRVELDGVRFQDPAFDLGFEAPTFRGYFVSNDEAYRARLDNHDKVEGKQSLLLHGQKPDDDDDAQSVDPAAEAERVLRILEENRQELARHAPGRDLEWALQNARVVVQSMRMRTERSEFLVRDGAMADNIAWILEQNPHAKMVVWAHNSHVSRAEGWMGSHLAERFGDQYVAFGFATASGRYFAWGDGKLAANDLLEPPPGSIESFFEATGEPRLVLDLRAADASGPSAWLHELRMIRGIGAVATDRQFAPRDVTHLWDAIIYIRDTTPARQLDTPPGRR